MEKLKIFTSVCSIVSLILFTSRIEAIDSKTHDIYLINSIYHQTLDSIFNKKRSLLISVVKKSLQAESFPHEKIVKVTQLLKNSKITIKKNKQLYLNLVLTLNGDIYNITAKTRDNLRKAMIHLNGSLIKIDIAKDDVRSVINKILKSLNHKTSSMKAIDFIIPNAHAALITSAAGAAALTYILIGTITAALVYGTILRPILELHGLGGDFCCKLAKKARELLLRYRKDSARCTSELVEIFNESLSYQQAHKKASVKMSGGWFDRITSKDSRFYLLYDLVEKESLVIALKTRDTVLDTCKQVKLHVNHFRFYGTNPDMRRDSGKYTTIVNDKRCVKEFLSDDTQKVIELSTRYARTYRACVHIARDPSLHVEKNYEQFINDNLDTVRIINQVHQKNARKDPFFETTLSQ